MVESAGRGVEIFTDQPDEIQLNSAEGGETRGWAPRT